MHFEDSDLNMWKIAACCFQ